jgi:hypothetical protein
MASWDAIKDDVEKNGNVKTLTMEELRDAHGTAKLGVNVRAQISSTLAGMGLGHIPRELPSYQNEFVRVYKKGTPIGEFIDTVLTPGPQNDSKLSERFSRDDVNYASIMRKFGSWSRSEVELGHPFWRSSTASSLLRW